MVTREFRVVQIDPLPKNQQHQASGVQPAHKRVAGKRNAANMAPFPFERLPYEMKLDVIEEMTPAYSLPEGRWPTGIGAPRERAIVPKLLLSCKSIRAIVKDMRRVVAVAPDFRVIFTFDLKRDTLQVEDMRLPRFEVNGKAESLPIRRLVTRALKPVPPAGVHVTRFQLRTIATEPWLNMPFETSLPMLAKLPLVEELTVIYHMLPCEWHIDSFQVFGPDIVGKRTDQDNWGLNRAYNSPQEYQAVDYFLENDIAPDTGVRWKLPETRPNQYIDFISHLEDLTLNFPGQNCIPYIGFNGYSKGTRSLGGKWAGFLYDPATETVKFRPLNWTEIAKGNREGVKDGSYGWVDVKARQENDPEWVGQLETTWKMVRATLVHDTLDQEYTLRMDSSC